MRIRAVGLCSIGLLVCALLLNAAARDQAAPEVRTPRRVTSFEHVNQELVIKCDVGTLVVKAWGDAIVQVRYFPRSARIALPLWGIQPVSAQPIYRVDSTADAVILSTALLTVSVNRKTAQLTFLDQKQTPLLVSGQIRLEAAQVSGEDTYKIRAEFQAPEDEAYYGLGLHGSGSLDQRGRTVRLWHDSQQNEGDTLGVPFLVTNHKYGFILDNPSKATVAPGKDGLTAWDAQAGDALSYFVIFGNTVNDIYKGYRTLTGATSLPPRSALGFAQGVPKSATQDDLLQLARKYREKNYPADLLLIHTGTNGIDAKRLQDPDGMNAEANKLGFRVIASLSPRLLKGAPHFEMLDAMGCIAKDKDGKPGQDARGSLLDVTKPSCAAWFWNDIQENYMDLGFKGWWLDGDQPDLLSDALVLSAGSGARLFNVFPSLQAKAVFEGHRKDLKERCLILSRWAYLGAQQYGTIFGASEAPARWSTLAAQIPAGLNMSASGFAWWSPAIGGPSTAGAISGADEYAELFSRWLEFGAFCPMLRALSPVPDHETAGKVAARYLGLRYRLLPYLYSLAHATAETGAPVMRALFMDFSQDPEVRDIKDEYLLGPAFLVAPVVEKGKVSREVYLPKGAAWYDYWTGKKFSGGQRIMADAPIDILPLFVRAGSVVPHGNPIPNTRVDQREIELWVYPGADAQFNLYQDDGVTYAYEKGNFSLAQIRWNEAAQKITITGDDRKVFSGPQDKWLKIIR